MKNTISCRKIHQTPELRYFHLQRPICVVEAETVKRPLLPVNLLIFVTITEHRTSRRPIPFVFFVVEELEFLFQAVSRLEKLQSEAGHLLLSTQNNLHSPKQNLSTLL